MTFKLSSGVLPDDVNTELMHRSLGALADLPEPAGVSLATVVVHRGVLVAEQYGPEIDVDSTLISWSMAKSITQAALGVCVRKGLLAIEEPAPVAAWQSDDRRRITIEHLLQMRSGLRWNEEYSTADGSDVIEMLFGSGVDDHATYAASAPLTHEPGTHWVYSSGTTNILARIISDAIGGGRDGMEAFLHDEIFLPLGMTSASPKFDTSGTFVGSSYVYATGRDFARFGELYRRGGVLDGRVVVPAAMAARAFTDIPIEVPAADRFGYADHWWTWGRAGFPGVFAAHGFEGQRIVVDPSRELTVVQLSKNPEGQRLLLDGALFDIVSAFPVVR